MRVLSVVLCLVLSHAIVAQTMWEVDSAHIGFVIKNAGVPVDGTFGGLQADLAFDAEALDQSMITASIETGTVHTGIRIRDKHLRKSDFFDAETYPHITMRSGGFRSTGDGQYIGEFALTLKGRQEHIHFPFTFQPNGPKKAVLQGSFTLNRQDYGIGGNSLILSDSVEVRIWMRVKEVR